MRVWLAYDKSASLIRPRRTRSLPADRPDDPRHQLRRPARRGRRKVAQGLDQVEHVVVRKGAEEVDEPEDRVVGDLAEEAHPALELARCELRDQPDGPVEQ